MDVCRVEERMQIRVILPPKYSSICDSIHCLFTSYVGNDAGVLCMFCCRARHYVGGWAEWLVNCRSLVH